MPTQAIRALLDVRDFTGVQTSVSVMVNAIRFCRGDVVLVHWQAAYPNDTRCDWQEQGMRGMAVGEIWFPFQVGQDTVVCVSLWRFVRTLPSRSAPALEVRVQDHPVPCAAEHLVQPCIHRRDAGGLCAVLLPRVPPFLRP